MKPQYKGKILVHDPSVPGPGAFIITHLGANVWGEAATVDFLTRLIKEQGAVIARDYRGNVEALSRGKYAVLVGPDIALLADFIKAGSPIKPAFLRRQPADIGRRERGGIGKTSPSQRHHGLYQLVAG